MKKITSILTLIIFTVLLEFVYAQETLSKKQFDELWNKADSIEKSNEKNGTSITKKLNIAAQEKMNNVDLTKKNIINRNNTNPLDSTDFKIFSTSPIINGTPAGKDVKPRQAKIKLDDVKQTQETPAPTKTVVTPVEKPKEKSVVPTTTKIDREDFSTKPIIKGSKTKETMPTKSVVNPVKKTYSFDTTKNFRDFTFDTKPIINNNATYERRNEPLPKSKEQIEDEIPVNKPNNTFNTEKENVSLKNAYAQYDKEADSLHSASKRRLDSIMAALNIKMPIVINPNDYMEIYMSGGGTLSSNSSKIIDKIYIQNSGLIQREYKTKNSEIQRIEKKISKDELSKLVQYIVDLGFLDFNDEYDCADNDSECNQRFSKSPQVVPFEISLTVGQKSNKINVSIYAPETEKNYVNYPENLEKITKAIYTIVERK